MYAQGLFNLTAYVPFYIPCVYVFVFYVAATVRSTGDAFSDGRTMSNDEDHCETHMPEPLTPWIICSLFTSILSNTEYPISTVKCIFEIAS